MNEPEKVEDPGIPLQLVKVYCGDCKGWYGDAWGSCVQGCPFDGLDESERPQDNLKVAVYNLMILKDLTEVRKHV